MGYFNYFIKCIIRNITYKLCKPKVFITVLLCVIILLFCFKNYGYCTEQIDPVITNPTEEYPDSYHVYDNQFLTVREIQESRQRKVITRLYALYDIKPDETRQFVSKILFELQDGSSEGPRCLYVSESSGNTEFRIAVYFPNKMVYTGFDGYTNNGTTYPSIPLYNGPVYYRTINSDSSFTMNSIYGEWQLPSAFMNVFIPEWVQMFKDFGLISSYTDSTIIQKLDELIAKSSSTTNQQILEEMKEQNQLQQEQNDFLQQQPNDNDISVDSFNNVDSNEHNDEK